jgi:predicted glutamine amidotransferase
MCIAILKTKNGIITDEELRNSFENNSDGAGIAYTHNNALMIVKGIFDVETFIKTVRQAEMIADNNMLIHCRIGTSGLNDKENTHPFVINNNICLIHNGILDITVPKGSKINDTQIFINKYMKGIKNDTIMKNKTFHNILEEMIGSSNKFVILNNKGEFTIINEKAGNWENGCWFSNNGHKNPRVKHTTAFRNWERYYNNYYSTNCCYAYDIDEDDYEDDYDELPFDKEGLTSQDYEEIVSQIQTLSKEKAEKLGYDVCYDAQTKQLISPCEADDLMDLGCEEIYPLYEISYELYGLYADFVDELLEEIEVA